jgi:hypothetical protein
VAVVSFSKLQWALMVFLRVVVLQVLWWCSVCVVGLAPCLVALFLGVLFSLCGRVCDGFCPVFRKLTGHSLLLN